MRAVTLIFYEIFLQQVIYFRFTLFCSNENFFTNLMKIVFHLPYFIVDLVSLKSHHVLVVFVSLNFLKLVSTDFLVLFSQSVSTFLVLLFQFVSASGCSSFSVCR